MIFEVIHKHFCTDDIRLTHTLVQASTKLNAKNKFNKLAKKRKNYPYCWNEVTLKDIQKAEILVLDD